MSAGEPGRTVVWVDASAGASGDMLLGALLGAGVPLEVLQDAVDAVCPEPVRLRAEAVTRGGLAATRCHVEAADSATHRTWAEVRSLLREAGLDPDVRDLAEAVFARLARAEGAVHGRPAEEVHFHEVGALDALADVVGVAAGLVHLGVRPGSTDVVVSPVAVGSGSVRAAHGVLPVPVPAVVALLHGVPSYAGPPGAPAAELCTPTGAALLATVAGSWGPQPLLRVRAVGVGAGTRDPEGHPNALRLLVGDPGAPASTTATGGPGTDGEVVVECNVDDLDPRVWPSVLTALLDAGAVDAWLTPIVMKKGRPAHTLSALVPPAALDAVRAAVFAHTSTIGVREHPVAKRPLDRAEVHVEVDGHPVRVKLSSAGGRVVTAQPEFDDVAAAAATLHRPVRDVLAAAQATARTLLD